MNTRWMGRLWRWELLGRKIRKEKPKGRVYWLIAWPGTKGWKLGTSQKTHTGQGWGLKDPKNGSVGWPGTVGSVCFQTSLTLSLTSPVAPELQVTEWTQKLPHPKAAKQSYPETYPFHRPPFLRSVVAAPPSGWLRWCGGPHFTTIPSPSLPRFCSRATTTSSLRVYGESPLRTDEQTQRRRGTLTHLVGPPGARSLGHHHWPLAVGSQICSIATASGQPQKQGALSLQGKEMSRYREIKTGSWLRVEASIYPKPSLGKMVHRQPKLFTVTCKDPGHLPRHTSGHLPCFGFPEDTEPLALWRRPAIPAVPLPRPPLLPRHSSLSP